MIASENTDGSKPVERQRTEALGLRRRRDKLAALNDSVTQATRLERQRAMRSLLKSPLLYHAGADEEAFKEVRKHAEWLRHWLAHHAGWSLHVSAEVIRLYKIPAKLSDHTRACRDSRTEAPFTRRRYVLLCQALSFLERSQRQTTLHELAKSVLAQIRGNDSFENLGISFALENAEERRDFVLVLRKLLDLHVIERVQGDEERYVHHADHDVLYNVHHLVLGRLGASRQGPSLLRQLPREARLGAIVAEPLADSEDGRNRQIRLKIHRRLLDDPVVFFNDFDEKERDYWNRQRSFILREIGEATGLVAEVRSEGVAMVDPIGGLTDWGLPEEGTGGHLTLLLATFLAERIRTTPGSTILFTVLCAQTRSFIQEHRRHWRKSVNEPGMDISLTATALEQLEGLQLVRREGETIYPLPPIGRFGLRGYVEG